MSRLIKYAYGHNYIIKALNILKKGCKYVNKSMTHIFYLT